MVPGGCIDKEPPGLDVDLQAFSIAKAKLYGTKE
jgi:hypothetical protein